MNARKLEFYIQMYFTLYPIHPSTGKSNQKKEFTKARADFKHYLDTRGADLSKTDEFLSYYALPYVDQPRDNPTFKPIFTHEWVSQITSST